MNGVRRLLGAGITSSPPVQDVQLQSSPSSTPYNIKLASGPTWPPQTPTSGQTVLPTESPKSSAASFLKKDRLKSQPPLPQDDDSGNPPFQTNRSKNGSAYSPRTSNPSFSPSSSKRKHVKASSSSPSVPSSPRLPLNRTIHRKSVSKSEPEWKRSSGFLNTRDELLMSLLASEAVVDSRDYEVLTLEDVEELKKEYHVLSSRLGAMTKKLSLETKIRDAAVSLSKVNAAHKKISKQTEEQLEAANRRVESAQKELWKVSDRVNEVQKKLLEHRAGVLSFSVRNMEKKMSPSPASEDSGYNSSNRSTLMTVVSSTSGASTSTSARFDGAHLFAGHADAVIPRRILSPEAAASEINALEEKLKAAVESLSAAGKKQADMSRELSLVRLEKQEVETMMGMELQNAEETISALEKELPRLEGLDSEVQMLLEEKKEWMMKQEQMEEQTRSLKLRVTELESRAHDVDGTEKLLTEMKEKNQYLLNEKSLEMQKLRDEWTAERAAWEAEKAGWDSERSVWDLERADAEDEKMEDLSRLQEEMERLREEDQIALEEAQKEIDEGRATIRALIKQYNVPMYSRDLSVPGLVQSVASHIQQIHTELESQSKAAEEWEVSRKRLEDDIRSGLRKQETLGRELEEVRRQRDEPSRKSIASDTQKSRPATPSAMSPIPLPTTIPADITIDSDPAKIASILIPIWNILPSPEARAAKFAHGSPRSYRTGSPNSAQSPGHGIATSLSDLDVRSLKSLYDSRPVPARPSTPGSFSIEGFAARVQALISDDRALIERLVRFAQAHDLLKKNAERAQKLAQEGNAALETYQKQVRILEERNMSLAAKHTVLQDEIQTLQAIVDRLTAEKQEVEILAAEQAETCRQLTEANNTLSARTLTLAEEAASAPEMVKKQLDVQLAECRKALEEAQAEINAMRTSEQSQRIALLDELNSMQTENGMLRAQLRAVKK